MSILRSSIVQLALIAAAGVAVWLVLNAVNSNLSKLPVHHVQQASAEERAADLPQIFPVWVEPKPMPAAVVAAAGSVDLAFGEVAQDVADEPVIVPNYGEALRGQLKIQGTTSEGAFINERYYAIGKAMDGLAFAAIDGSNIVPRLLAVAPASVVILAGSDRMVVAKGDAQWP